MIDEPGTGDIKIGTFEFSEAFWRKAVAGRLRMTTVVRIDHAPSIYDTHGSMTDADGNVTETKGIEVQADCHAFHTFGVFPADIYVPLSLDSLDELNRWQILLQPGSIHDLTSEHFAINHGTQWSITFYEPVLTPVPRDEYQDWVQYFDMQEDFERRDNE